MYTPEIIITAPTTWYIVKSSFKIKAPASIETTVEIPINDAVLFTPILAIATFDKKKAITEQIIP